MRKTSFFLIALLFLAGTSTALYAQSSADANVDVSALVDASLTVAVDQDVEFGNLSASPGGNYYLSTSVTGDNADANLGTGSQVGQITFSGLDGEEINITVSQSAVLTDSDGANDLDLAETIGDPNNDALLYDTGVAGTTTIEIGSGGNAAGDAVLEIGGELDEATTSGVYSTGNGGGAQQLIINGEYTSI